MDALILSCGTGGGHDSAGKAILEELKKRGHHATMLNPYSLVSPKLAQKINKTYISMVQHEPKVFGACYKLGNLYRRLPFRSPVYFANHQMNQVMQEYLENHPYDIVIMPHLFPAEILTNMKLHGFSVPKTMFVATDYVCIPFTEETLCDAYVIPAEDLTQEFVNKGIPREKIYPLGIPVGSSFSETETKEQARRKLGLEEDKKYILVAGGSMGGGKIEKVIHRLSKQFEKREEIELIVICGSNQKLYDRLMKHSSQGMMVIEYTEQMADYMRACDLFITKPGGLSSTEAAACPIPILYTAVIPGCESCNAEYFSEHGMGVLGKSPKELFTKVEELLENDEVRRTMILCQRNTIHKEAATDICKLAEQMVH